MLIPARLDRLTGRMAPFCFMSLFLKQKDTNWNLSNNRENNREIIGKIKRNTIDY